MYRIMMIIAIIVLSYTDLVQADNKGFIPLSNGYTRKNLHGGQNYYQGSKLTYNSRSNNFGGQNYYQGSKMTTFSRQNNFGGQTFRGK